MEEDVDVTGREAGGVVGVEKRVGTAVDTGEGKEVVEAALEIGTVEGGAGGR